jgi:hypothetical protein
MESLPIVRSSAEPLSGLAANHPCLWGEISQQHDPSWVLEADAYLLPTRSTGSDGSRWWEARKQGAISRDGKPISALTDLRGNRHIYPLKLDQLASVKLPTQRVARETVLYGGTLFDNFGHLLLDLSRTYQLLRLFRNSQEPFWFHYPGKIHNSEQNLATKPVEEGESQDGSWIPNPTIREWLNCLGILDRARFVQKTIKCSMLASSSVLYRDRAFVSTDFPFCAKAALAPKLRRKLLTIERSKKRIAYFSRHKLGQGTTQFAGEEEVVETLGKLANVDIICPEEFSIKDKLKLFRSYPLIAGFPQAGLILKYFVPHHQINELAQLFLFTAGPRSLNSNWVNLDRAFGFGDRILDCTPAISRDQAERDQAEPIKPMPPMDGAFQRSNAFHVGKVIDTMRDLASR